MGIARSVVQRLWPESTIVCIGGGPSLTAEDVDRCRGRARVIAVNDAYRLASWADVLYAHDARWWDYHQGVPTFHGMKYSLEKAASAWGAEILKTGSEHGLSLDRTALAHGRNSGYQAVNLAVHLGASRIVLLGYDMQKSADGREHWFGSHPHGVKKSLPLAAFAINFESLVAPLKTAGVSITNCSRETALTCFPRMDLDEALNHELSYQ